MRPSLGEAIVSAFRAIVGAVGVVAFFWAAWIIAIAAGLE